VVVPVVMREARIERSGAPVVRTHEIRRRAHERIRERDRSLLVRLVERHVRLERRHRSHFSKRVIERVGTTSPRTIALTRESVFHRSEPSGAYPRVVQTTLRARPTVASSRDAPAPSAAYAASPSRAMRESATARISGVVLSPDELSRVSNFVISELDRRVLSYRERTGQV
jgi:hypothetical protein